MARVTAKAVAAAVGVSVATVSNAYNRPDQLSGDLRAKILDTAKELGYPGPDAAGRTLRSGRAGAIGVLLTERLSYAFSDPYAIGFLTGLSEVVEQHGVSLVLMPLAVTDDGADLTAVRQATIDALTILCVSDVHPAAQLARARGIRLVGTAISSEVGSSWVAIDDELAGELVGRHLFELGHRRIAVIVDTNRPAGSPAHPLPLDEVGCIDCSARLRGLRRAFPKTAITVITAGHNAGTSGANAARWLLDRQAVDPELAGVSALVGLSDVLALGALAAMAERGVRAPADLSVCGFDDVGPAGAAGLTTVRQPITDKGRHVGELLLDPDREPRQVLLPVELVPRATTGPAAR